MITSHFKAPALDHMVRQVRNLFGIRNVYDQMDLDPGQWRAIAKEIIELTDSSEASNSAERSLNHRM